METEIKLLLRNRYDQVLQSYYSICAFLKALLFGIQGATAGWFTAKAERGLSVDCCFLLVSSMLSLPIPFLLCPGDGSINQPAIQGLNFSNSKSYSFTDFWDISFNFYIVLPGIETVKCVRVCMCACVTYSVIVLIEQ